MANIEVASPIDGTKFIVGTTASAEEIESALTKAETAQKTWRRSSNEDRAKLVLALAGELIKRKDDLAKAMTRGIGRPASQADETPRFRAVTQSQIEALEGIGDETYPSAGDTRRFTRRGAQGVHLSIAPWNYPVGMLPWLIVTPILAGNTVILKHAAQTAEVGRIVREAYETIEGPEGVLQVLELSHDQVDQIIKSERLKGVNFIGSVSGGLAIHRSAAGTLTHVHLELGGKDPAYVRADADLDTAIAEIADGCFSNAGQSCCSVERIYLHADIADDFIARFKEEMKKYRVGNPNEEGTTVGPVVKRSAADYIRQQIEDAVAKGADAYAQPGLDLSSVGDKSCYVEPTLLTGVDNSMLVMKEETFGPLACVQVVASDAEAIELMNDNQYGLTAGIWTQDIDAGLELVDQLDAGTVFINRCDHADLYLPWGGQKMSGLGRGNGREGLLGVMDVKSFHIRTID